MSQGNVKVELAILRGCGTAVATVAVVVGLWMAVPGWLYLTATAYGGDNMLALRLSGLALLLICISHWTPFSIFKKPKSVIIFFAWSLLVALALGVAYNLAEAHDVYRAEEGLLGGNPIKLAVLACICPALRAAIRLKSLAVQGRV